MHHLNLLQTTHFRCCRLHIQYHHMSASLLSISSSDHSSLHSHRQQNPAIRLLHSHYTSHAPVTLPSPVTTFTQLAAHRLAGAHRHLPVHGPTAGPAQTHHAEAMASTQPPTSSDTSPAFTQQPPAGFQPHHPLPVFGTASPTPPPPMRTPLTRPHAASFCTTSSGTHPTAFLVHTHVLLPISTTIQPFPQNTPPVRLLPPTNPHHFDAAGRALPPGQQPYEPEGDPWHADNH